MNQEIIKKLSDKQLIIKLMEVHKSKNITNLCPLIDIPYNTMIKWQCVDGMPTEIPSKGYTRKYLETLLYIKIDEVSENEELQKYREYFKLQEELVKINKL